MAVDADGSAVEPFWKISNGWSRWFIFVEFELELMPKGVSGKVGRVKSKNRVIRGWMTGVESGLGV
jgi:hypothetical protein